MEADLLIEVGIVAAILLALWVWPAWAWYRDRALRAGRALRLVKSPPVRPAGPPIEQIAADIRRVGAQIAQAPPRMPVAKLRGWLEAYDELLVAACQALGQPQRLSDLPEGGERDLERERVERLLMAAGLRMRSPA